MESENLAELVTQIANSKNQDDCSTAFCKIVNAKNPEFLHRSLVALEQISSSYYDRRIIDIAVDGLVDTVDQSLPVLIDYAIQNSQTPVGQDCIYALGEIAYKQCLRKKSEHPDRRILPALLDILQASNNIDSATFDACIGAISQHKYYGDMRPAQATFDRILDSLRSATSAPSYPYECISTIIELLASINGTDKVIELKAQFERCQAQSWLAKSIQDELAEKSF